MSEMKSELLAMISTIIDEKEKKMKEVPQELSADEKVEVENVEKVELSEVVEEIVHSPENEVKRQPVQFSKPFGAMSIAERINEMLATDIDTVWLGTSQSRVLRCDVDLLEYDGTCVFLRTDPTVKVDLEKLVNELEGSQFNDADIREIKRKIDLSLTDIDYFQFGVKHPRPENKEVPVLQN